MNAELPRACYVILHIAAGPSKQPVALPAPVVTNDNPRFDLSDDIWIQKLDEQTAKNAQRACEPPHFNVDSDHYDRHLYAFVRQAPATETRRYEGADALFGAIALSRLIHPTSTGSRYCGRMFQFGRPESTIQAVQFAGISPDVIPDPGQRDWLSVADGETLRTLMPWLAEGKRMHDRVHRAYWNHEYAMHSLYLDVRWPIIVTGLEALISYGDSDLGNKFKTGVAKLGSELGVAFSKDELNKAWRLRSKLVHAESFLHSLGAVLPESRHAPLYRKLELLLRSAVRRALLDASFGDTFASETAVRARWG